MGNKFLWIGLVFAFLWSSAAVATKFGLQSAQPFVLSVCRFFLAGILLLIFSHIILKNPLPQKKFWLPLLIYGALNISIYLGLYVLAMQYITAGLGSLAIAINPVFISFITAVFLRNRPGLHQFLSLVLCCLGVLLAAWPLLISSHASPQGLALLALSMLAYSLGAIYFANSNLRSLNLITVNAWQTLLGGILLVPILLFTYKSELNFFDGKFWGSTIWLAVAVSIGAVQCWLLLLRHNAVTAAYWLFLCPVFGFILAAFTLREPIGLLTLLGVLLVTLGLYLVQPKSRAKSFLKKTA